MRSKRVAHITVVVGLSVGLFDLLNQQCTREARAKEAAVVVSSGRASQTRAGERKPVTLEAIIRSWTARQENAGTLDLSAKGTQSFPAREVSADEATLPTGRKGQGFSVPACTFNTTVRFVADGTDRFRHDCVEKLLNYSKEDYLRQHSVEISKHDAHITYLPVSTMDFPIATIQKAGPYAPDRRAVLPIMMVYRAHVNGVFGTGDFVLTDEKAMAGEHVHQLLKCGENLIWVDTERDFLPTRFRRIVRGVARQAIDIEYAYDARHGWVLSAWTDVSEDRTGNPAETRNVRVKSCKINSVIDDTTFGVEFEPGTWVNDLTTDKTYILREGGARRIVRPGEYDGHNYKELLERAPVP
jgi:hypothetical protein